MRFLRVVLLSLAALSICGAVQAQDNGKTFGRELGRIPLGGIAQNITWSSDGKRIVVVVSSVASERCRIIAIDVSRRSIQWNIDGQFTHRSKAAFVQGGAQIVTRSLAPVNLQGLNGNSTLSILDAATGRILQHVSTNLPRTRLNDRAADFALSQDGRTLAAVTGSNILGFDVSTWTQIWQIGPMQYPSGESAPGVMVALDSSRNRIIVALSPRRDALLQTWDLARNVQLRSFVASKTNLTQMIFDPHTGVVITGGDGSIVGLPQLSGAGRVIVQDDPASSVRAWSPEGQLERTYFGPGRSVEGLALSADGRYLIASKSRSILPPPDNSDAYVLAWEYATGRPLSILNYGQGYPAAVAFSLDGRYAAIATGHDLQIIELDLKLFQK